MKKGLLSEEPFAKAVGICLSGRGAETQWKAPSPEAGFPLPRTLLVAISLGTLAALVLRDFETTFLLKISHRMLL